VEGGETFHRDGKGREKNKCHASAIGKCGFGDPRPGFLEGREGGRWRPPREKLNETIKRGAGGGATLVLVRKALLESAF